MSKNGERNWLGDAWGKPLDGGLLGGGNGKRGGTLCPFFVTVLLASIGYVARSAPATRSESST